MICNDLYLTTPARCSRRPLRSGCTLYSGRTLRALGALLVPPDGRRALGAAGARVLEHEQVRALDGFRRVAAVHDAGVGRLGTSPAVALILIPHGQPVGGHKRSKQFRPVRSRLPEALAQRTLRLAYRMRFIARAGDQSQSATTHRYSGSEEISVHLGKYSRISLVSDY
jgi:hypothetical protein